MVYEGFLRVGGVEVVNTERARGYLTTADCPINWIVSDPCPGLAEALGDDAYLYTNVSLAPWYDESLDDLSSRFYGVVGLRVGGTVDSTRGASKTEGVEDGGVIGRTRKGMRDVRVRATLMAQGRDALDYGTEWLSSVFDGTCSQHGAACETTDAEYMADCPPERGTVPAFTDWVLQATNLVDNANFEVSGASVEVRRNRNTNPRLAGSTTGWSTTGATSTTMTATPDGAQIDNISGAVTTVPLIFQSADFAPVVGDVWSASMEITVPVGFPAASVDLRVYAYGTGANLATSGSVTIQPGQTVTVEVHGMNGSAVAASATGIKTILYGGTGAGLPVGGRIIVRRAMAEKRQRTQGYFDGTTPLVTRRNAATMPQPNVSQGWFSNNGALYARTYDAAGGRRPGAGAVKFVRTASSPSVDIASAYGAGILAWNAAGRTPTGAGDVWTISAWATSDNPFGTYIDIRFYDNANAQVGSAVVSAIEYGAAGTWVRASATVTTPAGATNVGIVRQQVILQSGVTAGGEQAWMTDALFEKGAALRDFFDGSVGAPDGFGVGWDGAVGSTPSYMYDSDFTVAWAGAANGSESTLSGVTVPGGNVNGSGVAIRSTRWKKSGAYSLRLIPSLTSSSVAVSFGSMPNDAAQFVTSWIEAPLTGTIDAHAMTLRRTNPIQMDKRPNTAGEYDHRLISSSAGTNSVEIWGVRLGGGDIWFDVLTVIADVTYLGGAFTGDTPDDDLNRYSWTGTPGASDSTWETRGEIARPRTDEEYAALVDPLRRFMHDVAVTSGPLEVEIFQSRSGDYWGRVVEFTISSERAWIYGLTKELALNPALPSVVQDAPYNLIPYPSAEQNDLTSPTTRWIDGDGPVGSQLIIPTHVNPPGGQTTHPSVVDFGGSPFGGYRYWMAHTPYPGGNDAHEDPNIVASNDGTSWVIPAGLTNPIDNQPGSPGAYNSDVDLVYGPDNMLWLFWRTYDPAATGAEEKIYLSKSTNGTTWTAKTLIWQTAASASRYLSPSFIYESGAWTMYAINIVPTTPTLVRVRSTGTTLSTGGWNAPTVCTVTPALPAGRQLWHIEVRLIDGQYIALLNDCTAGASGTNGDLYMMVSTNGTDFTRASDVAIPRAAAMHSALYRATMVKKTANTLDVWYAGWVSSPSIIWNVFRTTITAPQYGAGVTVSTNLSTNPGVENDAAGWAHLSVVSSGADPAPFITSGRSTDIGAGGSAASFRTRLLGNNGSTVVNGAVSVIAGYQDVAIPAGTNRRISLNLWLACLILNGSAPGTVITELRPFYEFYNGSTLITGAYFGNATPAEFQGKSHFLAGLAVPAAATKVRVHAVATVTWTSSATAAQNSDIRLYADALTVSIP